MPTHSSLMKVLVVLDLIILFFYAKDKSRNAHALSCLKRSLHILLCV